MPPIAKDSDTPTATTETAARSGSAPASSNDSAAKPQPVALEVPVTVNGARTVEGSDKREPFSESTKTVMVHGSGAVIRLNSSLLAAGQLLFLTNERTKKEVVCQVVKSKNYRSASGYVELEFTEPAVGFWGMRFPGDRIGPGSQVAPAAVRPPAGNGSAVPGRPAASKTPTSVAGKPPSAARVTSSPGAKPSEPKPPAPMAPAASKPASPTASAISIVPAPLDSASLLGASKAKANSGTPAAPAATSLGSDTPLVEPWLKKPSPVSKVTPASPSAASPEAAGKPEEPEPSLPTAPNFELARPSDKPVSLFTPVEAPANLSKVDLSSIVPFFEVKPTPADAASQPAPPPQAPTASDAATEELKQHTERLQEELGKMPFAEPVSSTPAQPEAETPSFPLTEQSISVLKTELVHESAAKLLDDSAESNATRVLPEPVEVEEPVKAATPAPVSALESLEQEELKIPAWLEPLARNASAPSSTQELVLREKAKRRTEKPQLEELTAQLATASEKEKEQVVESRVPQFGSALPFEAGVESARESSGGKSGKGKLLTMAAVAAGIVALAGGWWYMNQQPAGVHANVAAEQASVAGGTSGDLQPNSTKDAAQGTALTGHRDAAASEAKPAAVNSNANAAVNTANRLSNSVPPSASAAVVRDTQPGPHVVNGGSEVTSAASTEAEAAPAEVKKPALGEVHLAAPKISQKRVAQNGAEPDAGISLSDDQPEANADSLGAGLGIANSQPAAPSAPVAVGGDVKQAKLISSVPPVYPALAKAQHVSGSVTIDALIDANGRVTTTKVISGPSLLQQAATEALKQWKYQPATLDGKPVAMHLTVTIQFRLQQ